MQKKGGEKSLHCPSAAAAAAPTECVNVNVCKQMWVGESLSDPLLTDNSLSDCDRCVSLICMQTCGHIKKHYCGRETLCSDGDQASMSAWISSPQESSGKTTKQSLHVSGLLFWSKNYNFVFFLGGGVKYLGINCHDQLRHHNIVKIYQHFLISIYL